MEYSIEVKWDSRINESRSFFFEIYTDEINKKLGWSYITKADYIFYGDAVNRLFYVFRADEMRLFLRHYKAEIQEARATDRDRQGRIKKISVGAIVPLDMFLQRVRV